MNKIKNGNRIFFITLEIFSFLMIFFFPLRVNAIEVGYEKNFSSTKNIQTFTVPETGYYQLEAWGAQGGYANSSSSGRGGYGAYATGVAYLKKNTPLYVVVGSEGEPGVSSNTGINGGYNGGGGSLSSAGTLWGAGGGATHMATTSGLLSTLSSNQSSILIVAGAGGGSGWISKTGHNIGGNAGGISGGTGIGSAPGKGGTQTAGGAGGGSNIKKGTFGAGGGTNSNKASGGGAGWYGGGTGYTSGSSAGGGSSYIGNSLLLSRNNVTKVMYCYSCTTSSTDSTYTVSTSNVSEEAISNYAKEGSGAAKITLLEIDNPELKTLTVSTGTFRKEFSPEVYEYNIDVASEATQVTIDATPLYNDSIISGLGTFDLVAGTTDIVITSTTPNGTVATYTLHFIRQPSSYRYLKDIQIDGVSINHFKPEQLSYDITVNYDVEKLNIDIIKGRPSQLVSLPSNLNIPSGDSKKEITVISEDGKTVTTYVLNIHRLHSSKLKNLSFTTFEINPDFHPDNLNYSVDILPTTLDLVPIYEAYDSEATITIDGFGYINSNKTATITVKAPGCVDTVYSVAIVKNENAKLEYDYPYTGNIETFIVPYTGYYRLETWGSQGGYAQSSSSGRGGYGAYATGVAFLKKDTKLYVVVGSQGKPGVSFNTGISGGYNGGGGSLSSPGTLWGAGGGATHIATSTGFLSTLSSYKSSVLIVSGAGGGSGWVSSKGYKIGGNAGGISGGKGSGAKPGKGGTQTAGGAGAGSNIKKGTFGAGGGTTSNKASGGGAGWYGGGTGYNYGSSAGGGSSYIGNSSLISYENITKVMYCYSCTSSTATKTYTISTSNVATTPTSYYAKSGDGHARITLVAQPSENNLLSEITTDKGTLTPTFNMAQLDYEVELAPEDDTITIGATPEDSKATVEGIGTFEVEAGDTTFPITVTAESGDIRVYNVKVHRDASSNPYPVNIKIEGLIPLLCSKNDSYCKLDQEFNPTTNSYTMTVPSRIKKLEFVVEKGHKYQTVTGDGEVTLESGMNDIEIVVTAEDKVHTATYTYHINRDMSGDNNIERLEVIDPVTDIHFDTDTTEYYFSIPNSYTKVGLNVVLSDSKATYEVIGNENFETGLNIVEIEVTAQNGERQTYTLNIYREQSGNTFLSNLEVSTDLEIFELNPNFKKVISAYTVKVGNEIDEVEIKATPEHSLTIVTGVGTKKLKVGTNVFKITSTAEDGSVQIYEVSVIRAKNSDATLKTLDVLEGILSPSFKSEEFEYSVEVNPGVTNLNLNVEPTVSTAKYKIKGNYGFQVNQDNVVSIVVTAEDGTTNTYKIHVTRKASNNTYLEYLDTNKYDMTAVFNKEIEEYDITVENDVSQITVYAEAEDKLSTVTGAGKYNLKTGNNDIEITVTSEEETSKTYILHIVRKYNSNANLISLTTDTGKEFDQTFDKNLLDYTLTVGSEVTELAIVGVAEEKTSKVTGNGTYSLHSGENVFKIMVEAEDGSTKEYSLVVTKEKSSNANLAMIIAKESVLDPVFEKNQTEYVLKVIESVTSLTLTITPEDSKATYRVEDNENFKIGNNMVTIVVEAEDGTVKEYHLDVLRQEAGTTSNRLENLEINPGVLNPTFHPDTNYYEVEVPYETTHVTLSGELEDKNATVTGFGEYEIEVGINVLGVKVTSVENVIRYYQVVVIRNEDSESRLASLQIENTYLNPYFNKDIYEYYLTTTETELNINAVPINKDATVEIIGNQDFILGANQVIIKVTAKDGKSVSNYILHVEKQKSYNNNLASLEVVGKELNPTFSKTTTVYYLDVDKTIESIQIDAIPEDKNATVEGDGDVDIVAGINYVEVVVTSEAGTKKVYTIIITKEQSNNAYLKSLEVSSGDLSPDFSQTENNYTVTVPYEIEEITVDGQPEEEEAIVVGFDKYSLVVGENTIEITVTAEDGTTNVYKVVVTREEEISSKLQSLEVAGYTLEPAFHKEVYDYNITIDYNVTSLNITAIPVDKEANVSIVDNENFVVGMNTVKILVTDRLGNDTSTYVLNVNRQNYSNTYLAYIYPNKGTLSPEFNKEENYYTVEVDSDVDSINIAAEPEITTNTLTGTGTYLLNTDELEIPLVVSTGDGISRTYFVKVIKKKSSINDLLSLQVRESGNLIPITPEFQSEITSYSATVDSSITNVEIIATADSSATIVGDGSKILNAVENHFEIVVEAEDGSTKTYELTINRTPSDNNHLITIIPSVGTLSPSFSYSQEEYSLVLDASSSILSFDVVTEDINAKVKGNEIQVIPDGLSTREIIVEAENGSIRKYTINIYKEKTDEARLSNLVVNGYTLNETFDKDTFYYTLTVPNEKNVLLSSDVEATPIDSEATVFKANSLVLTSTSTNIYTIIVTAKDGFTKQAYTIAIEREKGSDSTLLKLEFDSASLTEIFVSNKTEYTLKISESIPQINKSDVTAIPTDSDATVILPDTFTIDDDHTVYEIVVESADKSSTTTYTVYLERIISSNALLSSLSVDHGILSPDFDKNHNEYTLALGSEVDTLEITATTEDKSSKINGDGTKDVVTGLNRYEITVTAEDGTVNTYVIEATREKSSNTNIIDIIPSSGSLSPSYDNTIDTYLVEVGEEIDTIDFEVQLESKRATVIGDKGNSLDYGENNLTIIVEAEDGTTKEVYINVIREKKITDIEVPEEILMDIGDIEVVEPIITPNDATYKELVWESSNSDIVTVTDGTLEAKALGEVVVTVSSARDNTIQKEIKVRVVNLKISSGIYEVRRNVLFLDDDSQIQHLIIGAEVLEDLDTFISKLKNEKELIKIYTIDGVEITDTVTTTVSTGQIIRLEYNGKVYDSVYMVVRGEITKDGVIDADDYNSLAKQVLSKQKYDSDTLEFKASDVVETDEIDVDDSSKEARIVLKKN